MTKLELERSLYTRLTETSSALWRTVFVVERAGDDVYQSESKQRAEAVAEALNFVEGTSGK